MQRKDQSLIPPGEYCYRVVELREGEVLENDSERFGKGLREFSFSSNFKEVLCPYWQRTDYGTVRCNYLDMEVLDDEEPDAKRMVVDHFQDTHAPDKFGRSWALPDEIKVCNVKADEDEDWIHGT